MDGKPKNTGGRPTIIIGEAEFIKLCQIQCTQEEVASFFDCSIDAVESWCHRKYKMGFPDCLKKFGALGRMSLRRKMYQMAHDGNPTMCIWLSKQYLGMKENKETILVPTYSSVQIAPSGEGVSEDELQARIEQRLLEAK